MSNSWLFWEVGILCSWHLGLKEKNKPFLKISIFSEKRDQKFYFVLHFKIPLRKIAPEQS